MSQVLGEIPLTIKIRNGITGATPVAHKLVTQMQGPWGVSAVTVRPPSAFSVLFRLNELEFTAARSLPSAAVQN